jgi:DNA-binding MarR family transcriptional regulator
VVTTSRVETAEIAARLRLAIVRTSRRLRQQAQSAEGALELSPTLSSALATVDVHGPLTPSELAERERVKRPTATRTVARLEALGLIARTADPSDGRACLVATTTAGRTLMKRLRTRKNAYLSSRISKLEPSEVDTLERAAEILERLLEDENEAPPRRRGSATPSGLRDRENRT